MLNSFLYIDKTILSLATFKMYLISDYYSDGHNELSLKMKQMKFHEGITEFYLQLVNLHSSFSS